MNFLNWFQSTPPPRPTIADVSLLIEKEGKRKTLSVSEFEKTMKISYIPQLDFHSGSLLFSLMSKTVKLHKKETLSREQLWLGVYFQKEILSQSLPQISVRWLGEAIGWGVFAEQNFKELDYIGEYAGLVRRRRRSDARNPYCFEYLIAQGVRTSYTIDARDQGGVVRFINHSAKPNLHTGLATFSGLSHVVLFAAKPIAKGEQLLYDYGSDYWKKRIPPLNLDKH